LREHGAIPLTQDGVVKQIVGESLRQHLAEHVDRRFEGDGAVTGSFDLLTSA
jgi:hypothetical protein